jgi:hypothetical protein
MRKVLVDFARTRNRVKSGGGNYFVGLTVHEMAEALGVSVAAMARDLRMASLWIAPYVQR